VTTGSTDSMPSTSRIASRSSSVSASTVVPGGPACESTSVGPPVSYSGGPSVASAATTGLVTFMTSGAPIEETWLSM
jgi:hypothetical protein